MLSYRVRSGSTRRQIPRIRPRSVNFFFFFEKKRKKKTHAVIRQPMGRRSECEIRAGQRMWEKSFALGVRYVRRAVTGMKSHYH